MCALQAGGKRRICEEQTRGIVGGVLESRGGGRVLASSAVLQIGQRPAILTYHYTDYPCSLSRIERLRNPRILSLAVWRLYRAFTCVLVRGLTSVTKCVTL